MIAVHTIWRGNIEGAKLTTLTWVGPTCHDCNPHHLRIRILSISLWNGEGPVHGQDYLCIISRAKNVPRHNLTHLTQTTLNYTHLTVSLSSLPSPLSCRKLTAQVTQPTTASIIAMASSSEQEFIPLYRARLNHFPRHCRLWDSRTAARVADKLALHLHDIHVFAVSIDLQEDLSHPLHLRQLVLPLFDSVRRAGVLVHGAEKL